LGPTSKGRGKRERKVGKGKGGEEREIQGREEEGRERKERTLVGPRQHFEQIDAYANNRYWAEWVA